MAQVGRQAPKGYPALAQLMGPNAGMAVFKRFAELNVHSLLLQQAHLLRLEAELQAQQLADDLSPCAYNKKVHQLVDDCFDPGKKAQQWGLHVEIRERLKEYNEGLLRFAEVSSLPPPRKYDRGVLRDWYKRPEGGDNFLDFKEDLDWMQTDATEAAESDLVALSTRNLDSVTKWTAERLIPWLFRHNFQERASRALSMWS